MSIRCLLVAFALLLLAVGCSEKEVILGVASYENTDNDPRCRNSAAGGIVNVNQPGRGIDYGLRTPKNYQADVRHPLLVVFPAAGQNNFYSEAFTRFTYPATTAGFVVLYPSHRPLGLKTISEFAKLVANVATQWCIDKTRIYFTGHSDGGTVTQVLAQSDVLDFKPAAIAPSAAGVRAEDLAATGCLNPVSTMLMHNSDDKLFPNFGRGAASWWVKCNQCKDETTSDDGACVIYSKCIENNQVAYCEASGGHRDWLQPRTQILEFLLMHLSINDASNGSSKVKKCG